MNGDVYAATPKKWLIPVPRQSDTNIQSAWGGGVVPVVQVRTTEPNALNVCSDFIPTKLISSK